jgi:hypothetical protein
MRGRRQRPHQSLDKVRKYRGGGRKMPPNSGIVRPHDVQVEPFFSKIRLNASLDDRVFAGSLRSNSLPRGHADLNGGHPGLGEHRGERVAECSGRREAGGVARTLAGDCFGGLERVGGVARTPGVECFERRESGALPAHRRR